MIGTPKHLIDWKYWDDGEIGKLLAQGAPRETSTLGVPGPHAGPDPGDDLPEDVPPAPACRSRRA